MTANFVANRDVHITCNIPRIGGEKKNCKLLNIWSDFITTKCIYKRWNQKKTSINYSSINLLICTGSSGYFSYIFTYDELRKYGTKKYFLHVEAIDPKTNDSVMLKGAFRVFGHQEMYFCTLNMINTATTPIPQGGSVEFISVGHARDFICKIDGESHSCKYHTFPENEKNSSLSVQCNRVSLSFSVSPSHFYYPLYHSLWLFSPSHFSLLSHKVGTKW